MKFLGNICVFLCCIVGALSQTTQTPKEKQENDMEILRAMRKCIFENKVTYTLAFRYAKGDFKDDSDKGKCFVKCFAVKMKLFDSESGDVQHNELLKYVSYLTNAELDFPKIIESCGNNTERSDSQCDFVFRMYKCIWDGINNSPEPENFRLSFYDVFGLNELYDNAEIRAELEAEAQEENDAELVTEKFEDGEIEKYMIV